jgi:hypothetical protein
MNINYTRIIFSNSVLVNIVFIRIKDNATILLILIIINYAIMVNEQDCMNSKAREVVLRLDQILFLWEMLLDFFTVQ